MLPTVENHILEQIMIVIKVIIMLINDLVKKIISLQIIQVLIYFRTYG
jgi:hypothetical protein